MNLKQLKKQIKENGYIGDFEIYDEDNVLCIYIYGSTDKRVVTNIEIEYQNQKEKQEIIDEVEKLLERFDFSFYLQFETLDELKLFVN